MISSADFCLAVLWASSSYARVQLVLTDKDAVRGLPPTGLALAAQTAVNKGHTGATPETTRPGSAVHTQAEIGVGFVPNASAASYVSLAGSFFFRVPRYAANDVGVLRPAQERWWCLFAIVSGAQPIKGNHNVFFIPIIN